MGCFTIGADLAQSRDFTAITVVERVLEYSAEWAFNRQNRLYCECEERHHLIHLERLRRGTPYTGVVRRLVELAGSERLGGQALVVIDATGLGKPVFDMAVERYHEEDPHYTMAIGMAVSRRPRSRQSVGLAQASGPRRHGFGGAR